MIEERQLLVEGWHVNAGDSIGKTNKQKKKSGLLLDCVDSAAVVDLERKCGFGIQLLWETDRTAA